jgi:hypothetical protein
MFGEESYFLSQDLFVKDSVYRTSSDQQLMSMMGKPEMRPKYPRNAYVVYNKRYHGCFHMICFHKKKLP